MDIREETARALHADDVAHGKAFSEFEDMNADARAWYYDNADALMPLVARIQAEAIRHVLDGTILSTGDVKSANGSWRNGGAVWDSREHYDAGMPRPMEIHEWLAARADRQENPT